MNATLRKIAAIVEVALVTFVFVPYLTVGINRLFPGFEAWQTDTLGFSVPVFIYVVEAGLSILVILLHRKKLADYGIHFRALKYQLDIAATCFIPVALASFALMLDYKNWGAAILIAVVQVGLLFVLGILLRKKIPAATIGTAAAALVLFWPTVSSGDQSIVVKAIVTFLTYALFVGFGEEILFRGYMQSRLNEVFGKPYRFYEVPFGWGAIIAALLFGLMHVGILRWILGMDMEVTLAWGFWTIFSGLVYSFVREKSGGILAPALLHGMPQAIAFVIFLFIQI